MEFDLLYYKLYPDAFWSKTKRKIVSTTFRILFERNRKYFSLSVRTEEDFGQKLSVRATELRDTSVDN